MEKGEPLYAVHADFAADFRFAKERVEQDVGYTIGKAAKKRAPS